MVHFLTSPELWLSLATLTFLEIILGIDNVVFVSVAAGRVPPHQQARARSLGIYTGAVLRVAMLFGLVWLSGLTQAALFHLPAWAGALSPEHPSEVTEVTLEDLVLLLGGLFLLWKGTDEIHDNLEGGHGAGASGRPQTLGAVLAQMMLINIVFSLDSVLTALGMTAHAAGAGGSEAARLIVMIAAIAVSTAVMVGSARAVSGFLHRHPTTRMLALAFILLVGVALIADGLGFHIPRGYLYFAIAFSLFVETMNVLAARARGKPGGDANAPH